MTTELTTLFERDLARLRRELEAFPDEKTLWMTAGNVPNSAGNLSLHLVGNLKTYIGKNLGHHPYERNRDAEFSRKDVPRQHLLEQVAETALVVRSSLEKLAPSVLEQPYPEEVLGYPMTTGFFLIHLTAHLSYHLGQINYLRRVLT